jgi:hypothetical protein
VSEGHVYFSFNRRAFDFDAVDVGGGEALVTVRLGNETLRQFRFPAYKIWNIPAHADDIVDGILVGDDWGLRIAGSDGLGGNAYPPGAPPRRKGGDAVTSIECAYCGRKRSEAEPKCPGCGNTGGKEAAPDRVLADRRPLGEFTLETFVHHESDMVRLRLSNTDRVLADIYVTRLDFMLAVPKFADATPFILDVLSTALRETGQEDLIPRLRHDHEPMRYHFVPDRPIA